MLCFSLHFLANIQGAFIANEEEIFFGKFIGGGWRGGGGRGLGDCSSWGLIIRSCQGLVSFTNAFSSNLKTVNLKILPIMKGCTIEDKALSSPTELWKYLYLKLMVINRFQSLRHVQPDVGHIIYKVKSTNRGLH